MLKDMPSPGSFVEMRLDRRVIDKYMYVDQVV